MDDLINRQALIEHLRRTIEASNNDGDYNEGFNDGMDFAACFASTLPSAQPEVLTCGEGELNVPNTNVMDMISRQAAIDAFAEYIGDVSKIIGSRGQLSAYKCKDIARRVLGKLPSVQPERKKGEWMHQASDSMVPYQYADCKAGSFIPWNYCPNCGRKMIWNE